MAKTDRSGNKETTKDPRNDRTRGINTKKTVAKKTKKKRSAKKDIRILGVINGFTITESQGLSGPRRFFEPEDIVPQEIPGSTKKVTFNDRIAVLDGKEEMFPDTIAATVILPGPRTFLSRDSPENSPAHPADLQQPKRRRIIENNLVTEDADVRKATTAIRQKKVQLQGPPSDEDSSDNSAVLFSEEKDRRFYPKTPAQSDSAKKRDIRAVHTPYPVCDPSLLDEDSQEGTKKALVKIFEEQEASDEAQESDEESGGIEIDPEDTKVSKTAEVSKLGDGSGSPGGAAPTEKTDDPGMIRETSPNKSESEPSSMCEPQAASADPQIAGERINQVIQSDENTAESTGMVDSASEFEMGTVVALEHSSNGGSPSVSSGEPECQSVAAGTSQEETAKSDGAISSDPALLHEIVEPVVADPAMEQEQEVDSVPSGTNGEKKLKGSLGALEGSADEVVAISDPTVDPPAEAELSGRNADEGLATSDTTADLPADAVIHMTTGETSSMPGDTCASDVEDREGSSERDKVHGRGQSIEPAEVTETSIHNPEDVPTREIPILDWVTQESDKKARRATFHHVTPSKERTERRTSLPSKSVLLQGESLHLSEDDSSLLNPERSSPERRELSPVNDTATVVVEGIARAVSLNMSFERDLESKKTVIPSSPVDAFKQRRSRMILEEEEPMEVSLIQITPNLLEPNRGNEENVPGADPSIGQVSTVLEGTGNDDVITIDDEEPREDVPPVQERIVGASDEHTAVPDSVSTVENAEIAKGGSSPETDSEGSEEILEAIEDEIPQLGTTAPPIDIDDGVSKSTTEPDEAPEKIPDSEEKRETRPTTSVEVEVIDVDEMDSSESDEEEMDASEIGDGDEEHDYSEAESIKSVEPEEAEETHEQKPIKSIGTTRKPRKSQKTRKDTIEDEVSHEDDVEEEPLAPVKKLPAKRVATKTVKTKAATTKTVKKVVQLKPAAKTLVGKENPGRRTRKTIESSVTESVQKTPSKKSAAKPAVRAKTPLVVPLPDPGTPTRRVKKTADEPATPKATRTPAKSSKAAKPTPTASKTPKSQKSIVIDSSSAETPKKKTVRRKV